MPKNILSFSENETVIGHLPYKKRASDLLNDILGHISVTCSLFFVFHYLTNARSTGLEPVTCSIELSSYKKSPLLKITTTFKYI